MFSFPSAARFPDGRRLGCESARLQSQPSGPRGLGRKPAVPPFPVGEGLCDGNRSPPIPLPKSHTPSPAPALTSKWHPIKAGPRPQNLKIGVWTFRLVCLLPAPSPHSSLWGDGELGPSLHAQRVTPLLQGVGGLEFYTPLVCLMLFSCCFSSIFLLSWRLIRNSELEGVCVTRLCSASWAPGREHAACWRGEHRPGALTGPQHFMEMSCHLAPSVTNHSVVEILLLLLQPLMPKMRNRRFGVTSSMDGYFSLGSSRPPSEYPGNPFDYRAMLLPLLTKLEQCWDLPISCVNPGCPEEVLRSTRSENKERRRRREC